MAKKTTKKHSQKQVRSMKYPVLGLGLFLLTCLSSVGAFHYVRANSTLPVVITDIQPNFGIKNKVIDFFEANDASEMVPIIKCESQFRHYGKDGTPLKNSSGSSAVGVTQIMASLHPDIKVLNRYNKRHNTDLTAEDFDVTTFEGNIGYALVLYKMNGTSDWECSKKFRF